METLTIGKMAKLNGISEQTLRLYDKIGLVVPCDINKNTGYRYYSIRQCAQLDMIQYMKSLNMTLSQIKDCMESGDSKKLLEILMEQKKDVKARIEKLCEVERAIDKAIENHKRYEAVPEVNIPVLEFQNERFAFVYDTDSDCFSYDVESYEKVLRTLKDEYKKFDMPQRYVCNAGTILRKENFIAKKIETTEMMIFVDDSCVEVCNVEPVPGGMYICMYCNGFANEKASFNKLIEYVTAKGYEVTGDCFSEVLIEFPTLKHYERKAFFKLQAPVQKKYR